MIHQSGLPDGHRARIACSIRMSRPTDALADDMPGEHFDDERHVNEPGPCRDIGGEIENLKSGERTINQRFFNPSIFKTKPPKPRKYYPPL